ncbi:hypothetical protein M404DRAFT_515905 [Pisolithus tinctorius Marx 270]|uniref:Uncharacterized protein n=1 Tax=Pisolithus tinctorius Marx 270 TaxID=870435 RepID=A0A0C3MWR7_PISTI|nr:hypothetical protein M404DRAFT_515905 [Pisolithus tinctorius Marx 270]
MHGGLVVEAMLTVAPRTPPPAQHGREASATMCRRASPFSLYHTLTTVIDGALSRVMSALAIWIRKFEEKPIIMVRVQSRRRCHRRGGLHY